LKQRVCSAAGAAVRGEIERQQRPLAAPSMERTMEAECLEMRDREKNSVTDSRERGLGRPRTSLACGAVRGQQQPIPGRLEVARCGEEGEADAGRAVQESGLGAPAGLTALGEGPDAIAPRALPRSPESEGALIPGAGHGGETRLSGRLVEPVEEMAVASGAVAEAGVEDGGVSFLARCGGEPGRQGLGGPIVSPVRPRGGEEGRGQPEIAVAPGEPGARVGRRGGGRRVAGRRRGGSRGGGASSSCTGGSSTTTGRPARRASRSARAR